MIYHKFCLIKLYTFKWSFITNLKGCCPDLLGLVSVDLSFLLMTCLYEVSVFLLYFWLGFPLTPRQGEQSKMIGASGLLERKQNITGKFFALKKEENKAFEQKT